MAKGDPVSVALEKAAARAARVAALDAVGAQQVDPDVENGNDKAPERTFCRSWWALFFVWCCMIVFFSGMNHQMENFIKYRASST